MMASRASSVLEAVFATSQTVDHFTTFLAHILPPLVCQYLMGVLVQLEGTRTYRMALLPVTVYLAWRATLVDMSGGETAEAQTLVTQMCALGTTSAVWAFARVPYRRHTPVDNRNKSNSNSVSTACWNTWDLLINPRGIGWNWSRGLVIPKPPFETDSRVVFVLSSAVRCVFHAVAFDACLQTIRNFSPETFGSLQGGSLFDHTLPPVLELLRAMLVTLLTGAVIYFGMQFRQQFLAIVCVILFHQHPSQWPPLFDAPWSATSLGELWGRRWHQIMRHSVLNLGDKPFSFLFGRVGGLLGAFFVSGIFHNFELGQGGYSVVCIGYWLMNGVGILLERLWKRATGRMVGGILGWTWMFGWLFLWSVPMVNVYAKLGRFGAMSVGGGLEPSLALVALVRRFFDIASS